MADTPKFFKLLSKLKKLRIPSNKYVVFGSALLAVKGIRDVRDLDVITIKDVYDRYKQEGWNTGISAQSKCEYIEKDNIEMWKEWWPGKEWDVKKLISEAEIIEGMPFVKFGEVIKWKKLLGREKDLKDLELISAYLKNLSEEQ